jgi:hypothetical protein
MARIVQDSCELRRARHEALFFHNIDVSRPSAEEIAWPECWREIPHDIFPPRKSWNRFRPKNRSDQSRDYNLETLVRAVRHLQ